MRQLWETCKQGYCTQTIFHSIEIYRRTSIFPSFHWNMSKKGTNTRQKCHQRAFYPALNCKNNKDPILAFLSFSFFRFMAIRCYGELVRVIPQVLSAQQVNSNEPWNSMKTLRAMNSEEHQQILNNKYPVTIVNSEATGVRCHDKSCRCRRAEYRTNLSQNLHL